ncbi:diacylglycerol kinase [Gordonia terrae C-6]|uniref:Diacylglycerol kinase n=1 Tax=Gordonia terrae C-6 TaxID=1316928 RepID=R7Y8K2_9ACTN|nr:diacylglycerol kinase [Gordonia terrae C-6]
MEIIVGEDVADAADLAGKAARGDTDVIVVVGGDGTVRLAVEATIGSGKPLAVIPAGSGNDFARNLGIPLDPADAVEVILAGHRRAIDLGRVSFPDGQTALFSTVAATGFDAAVTARAIDMRRPRGQSRYTIAALLELLALRSRHYQVRVDDHAVESDLIFAAIGNTTSYGGGMKITPAASITDGQLDVTLALTPPRMARWTIARVFPKVFSGKHIGSPNVRTMRGAEVELYCDPPALVSVDGDLVGQLPAVFEAVPHAIEVFAPAS